MNKQKILIILGAVLGIVFFIVGFIYATHSAGNLPTFFPGYSIGATNIHTKHSIAAFIAGVACFIFAWFQSGPKKTI
jgi:asparagine N-glycosylation enzyme membrane subunit Stt3